MSESGIIYLIWGDLTGLARCRGVPLAELLKATVGRRDEFARAGKQRA